MAFDPVTVLLEIGGKVIDRIWPDPAQAALAKVELYKMQQTGELALLAAETALAKGQLGVNVEEAKNPSIFVAGWRPFIGWVCGLACAWNWLGLPIALLGLKIAEMSVELSPASLTEMMPILIGMLGLGGYRTVEKLNNVASVTHK